MSQLMMKDILKMSLEMSVKDFGKIFRAKLAEAERRYKGTDVEGKVLFEEWLRDDRIIVQKAMKSFEDTVQWFTVTNGDELFPFVDIIRRACTALSISQKELAERVGMHEASIRNIASGGKITDQLTKTIELMLENEKLKRELQDYKNLQEVLRKAIK